MESLDRNPLAGNVEVDEFMIGQKEPGKKGRSKGSKRLVIISIERRGEKGVGRGYATMVENASSEQIEEFLDEKVDKDAQITTDEWRGYAPLKANWNIKQKKSDLGKGMPQIHNIIMNLKSWLRGIHHKCSKAHLQSYLNEFFYRFNRRNSRNTIFDGLIIRMMQHHPFSIQDFRIERNLCA
jgi:transposase-like protein